MFPPDKSKKKSGIIFSKFDGETTQDDHKISSHPEADTDHLYDDPENASSSGILQGNVYDDPETVRDSVKFEINSSNGYGYVYNGNNGNGTSMNQAKTSRDIPETDLYEVV